MKYLELKQKQEKEVNEFPLGFAFSKEQFEEMMKKFGLDVNDTDKIYSLGAGGYVKKSDAEAMDNMFLRHAEERQKAIDDDKTGTGYIYEMFAYELANHEYCVTYDLDETLDALNLTMEEIKKDKRLMNGLKKALKKYEE